MSVLVMMSIGVWAPVANKAVQPEKGHAWLWNGSTWQCQHCLRIRKKRQKCIGECSGVTPSLKVAFQQSVLNGHRLHGALDETGLMCCWCSCCGKYMSHKAVGLTEKCRLPTRQGRTVLNRVANKRHPERKLRIGQPIRLHSTDNSNTG